MKWLERVLTLVERANAWISRMCVRVFGALWRWQSRRSVPLRFAVGFVGLSLIMTGAAYLANGGWTAWAELDDAFLRYLENAGHLAAGTRLAWAAIGAAALCVLAAFAAMIRIRSTATMMVLSILLLTTIPILSLRRFLSIGLL